MEKNKKTTEDEKMGLSSIKYCDNGELGSWMDFRDLLINTLKKCDTELQLNKLMMGIVLSIAPSAEDMTEARKLVGMKTTKKDEEKFKRLFESVEGKI